MSVSIVPERNQVTAAALEGTSKSSSITKFTSKLIFTHISDGLLWGDDV